MVLPASHAHRPEACPALPGQIPRFYRRRHSLPRPGHRRQHRDFQPRERIPPPVTAGKERGRTRPLPLRVRFKRWSALPFRMGQQLHRCRRHAQRHLLSDPHLRALPRRPPGPDRCLRLCGHVASQRPGRRPARNHSLHAACLRRLSRRSGRARHPRPHPHARRRPARRRACRGDFRTLLAESLWPLPGSPRSHPAHQQSPRSPSSA